ncbi:MAG: hypothetical protein GY862_08580 [Gammaproteobacteria bacterium]|nr:hypothetical protein [Gammaproteobacteria bacterium]
MATLHITGVSHQVINTYAGAPKDEQDKIKRAIEGVILRRAQPFEREAQLSKKLLQKGKCTPFLDFKAIKMTGTGPTASEMVIQDRE